MVGGVIGGVLGAVSNLGELIVSRLQPDLIGEDVVVVLGACGGVLLGVFIGACLFALVLPKFWPQTGTSTESAGTHQS